LPTGRKALEGAGEVLLGGAYPRVRDAYNYLVFVRVSGDLYAPHGRDVLHGVLYEVREHGGELRLIAPDVTQGSFAGALPGEGYVLPAGSWSEAGEHDHQDGAHIHGLGVLDTLLAL
jgi:hypothetical protein